MGLRKKTAELVDAGFIKHVYEGYLFDRRSQILTDSVSAFMQDNSSVLDIGCGNGQISYMISQSRPGMEVTGIDIMERKEGCFIPVGVFDGEHIPYEDNSFDFSVFVDVLHHADNPLKVMAEAVRVARKAVIIKDHAADRFLALPTLRFMDWVGNARYGVVLPYHYWKRAQWEEAFKELGVSLGGYNSELKLYPWPFDWLFGRSLQFVCRLDVNKPLSNTER